MRRTIIGKISIHTSINTMVMTSTRKHSLYGTSEKVCHINRRKPFVSSRCHIYYVACVRDILETNKNLELANCHLCFLAVFPRHCHFGLSCHQLSALESFPVSALTMVNIINQLYYAMFITTAVAAGGPLPNSFEFKTFFQGDWAATKGSAFMNTGEQAMDNSIQVHYSIQLENVTQNLVGSYYENDTMTGEISNKLQLYIEFEEGEVNKGAFKTGHDDEFETLFEFDFHQQPNDIVMSFGKWHGSSEGYYQIAISGNDRFTISLTPLELNAEAEAQLWSVKRIPRDMPQTFFEKYRTMIMMGGMLLFNMFIQRKTREIAPSPGPAPGSGGGAGSDGVISHTAGSVKKKK
eukprot:g38409.t1